MTRSATTAFNDFYALFPAPFGECLTLCNPVTGNRLVAITHHDENGKPKSMSIYPLDWSGARAPDISIRTQDNTAMLHTSSHGQQILANDWIHLAEQLQTLGDPDFPDSVLSLMMQAGGDEDYEEAFILDM